MENKLFLIIGHSGSGKTSVMREVMDNELISLTTRKMREGEIHGETYYYVTEDEFSRLADKDKLIERVEYGGNHYGISKEEYNTKLANGHAFCIVDLHGVEQFKKLYGNCVTIFIYTTFDQARKRMIDRGDSEKDVCNRLSTYHSELKNKMYSDYVIRNNEGQFDKTVDIFKSIIESEVGR